MSAAEDFWSDFDFDQTEQQDDEPAGTAFDPDSYRDLIIDTELGVR